MQTTRECAAYEVGFFVQHPLQPATSHQLVWEYASYKSLTSLQARVTKALKNEIHKCFWTKPGKLFVFPIFYASLTGI